MDTEYTLAEEAAELLGSTWILEGLEQERAELLAPLDARIKDQRQVVEQARADMHERMVRNGVKSVTHEAVTITRVFGTQVEIVDEDELKAALAERGLLDSVTVTTTRLDKTKAKQLAEMSEMPGVQRVPYDRLQVKAK